MAYATQLRANSSRLDRLGFCPESKAEVPVFGQSGSILKSDPGIS